VTVTHGTNTVLGLAPERIAEIPALLAARRREARMPPLWDGNAGARAALEIERVLGLAEQPAEAPAAPGPVALPAPAVLPASPTH
jgi:hypothetical protein